VFLSYEGPVSLGGVESREEGGVANDSDEVLMENDAESEDSEVPNKHTGTNISFHAETRPKSA
jgi:hypothetical protein